MDNLSFPNRIYIRDSVSNLGYDFRITHCAESPERGNSSESRDGLEVELIGGEGEGAKVRGENNDGGSSDSLHAVIRLLLEDVRFRRERYQAGLIRRSISIERDAGVMTTIYL